MLKFFIYFITIFLLLAKNSYANGELAQELIYRVSLGQPADVKLLLRRTRNPNQTDSMGWPLLSIAAARTDKQAINVVKLLVKAGADINFGGRAFMFPLMSAMQSGNLEVTKYLLDKGADYRKRDIQGIYLVEFARQTGNEDIIKLIEAAIDRDINEQAAMSSQRNLDRKAYSLAYNCCASQYYSFYYKLKMDNIDKQTQDETLQKYLSKLIDDKAFLMRVFRISSGDIDEFCKKSREKIYNEARDLPYR